MKVTKGMKTMIDVESLILMFMNSHLAICHRHTKWYKYFHVL